MHPRQDENYRNLPPHLNKHVLYSSTLPNSAIASCVPLLSVSTATFPVLRTLMYCHSPLLTDPAAGAGTNTPSPEP